MLGFIRAVINTVFLGSQSDASRSYCRLTQRIAWALPASAGEMSLVASQTERSPQTH
jgi:hypothetical protein